MVKYRPSFAFWQTCDRHYDLLEYVKKLAFAREYQGMTGKTP